MAAWSFREDPSLPGRAPLRRVWGEEFTLESLLTKSQSRNSAALRSCCRPRVTVPGPLARRTELRAAAPLPERRAHSSSCHLWQPSPSARL